MKATFKKSAVWLPPALLIVLFILPSTRPVVRTDLEALCSPPSAISQGLSSVGIPAQERDVTASAAVRQAAAAHPDDVDLRITAVLDRTGAGTPQERVQALITLQDLTDGSRWIEPMEKAQALEALSARFPNNPAIPATILRLMAGTIVRVDQEYWRALIGDPQCVDLLTSPVPSERQAFFDRAAEAGERLDPTNAYFPFMRALELFEWDQSGRASTEIIRAGRCSRWEDYAGEEYAGSLKAVPGLPLTEMASLTGSLAPDRTILLGVTYAGTCFASACEADGQQTQGFAIRCALAHCGSLIRAQSHTMFGSLVGVAITPVTMLTPGGWNPLRPRITYGAYLRQIAHPEEDRWVKEEVARGQQVRELARRGEQKNLLEHAVDNAVGCWAIDMLLLGNAISLLFLAGIASLRWRPAQGRLPAAAVVLALCGLLALAATGWTGYMGNMGGEMLQLRTPGGAPTSLRWWTLVFLWSLPALVVLIGALRSRGEDFTGRFLRRVRRGGLVLGSVLLFLYGLFAPHTLHVDTDARHVIAQSIQHEGQFWALSLHQSWPGPTPGEPQRPLQQQQRGMGK